MQYDVGVVKRRRIISDPMSQGPVALPSGYTAQGVRFNGTSTYATDSSALTGLSNTKKFILSFWFKNIGATGGDHQLLGSDLTGAERLRFSINGGDDKLQFACWDISSVVCLNLRSTTTYVSMSNWAHCAVSVDLNGGAAGTHQLYVNGASDLAGGGTFVDTNMDIGSSTHPWRIGNDTLSGTTFWNGDMADFQMWFDQSLDLSVPANLALFRSGGAPVDPATAALTLGTPMLKFSGSVGSWLSNSGSGGTFTANDGSLAASPSNPP